MNIYDPHPPFIPPRAYAERFDLGDVPGPHVHPNDAAAKARLAEIDFQTKGRAVSFEEGREAQAKYYAMIAQIDDPFARILAALEETGQRANTVIVSTSDHGEMLGDHGLMLKSCRFYEGLVRVPLIVSWPGQFAGGVPCDDLVELLDLSATLLDLAGVEIPEDHQGFSLLPRLRGGGRGGSRDGDRPLRAFVRCLYFDSLDPHFTGGSGSFATMHRTRRHKLVVYHGTGLGELFDLEVDPWEHHDLWDDPGAAEVKQRLLAESFDAHVLLTTDVGARRIAPM